MQAEHDPDRILQVTAELLPRMVRADRFAIFEADWDSYKLRPRVLAGGALDGLNEMDISLDRGITGWAFLRSDPYNCPDTRSHSEAVPIPGQDESTIEESMLVVPLIAGDHRLGVIDMWRNGLSQFTDEDLERCALFGLHHRRRLAQRPALRRARAACHDRPPDRAAEPSLVGRARAAARPREAPGRAPEIAHLDDRPRPLQARQRPVWPRRG